MSVCLVGGGSLAASDAVSLFIAEASARGAAVGRSVPRIGLLAVGQAPVEALVEALSGGRRAEVVAHRASGADGYQTSVLSDIDALVVTGAEVAPLLDAVRPLVDQIRLLVSDGLPYLGHAAGASAAADRALVGGWRIGGVEVCQRRSSGGHDEVTVREGLGLVDLTVDTAPVRSGTLSRLVAATEAGIVAAALGIDEDTALVVGEGPLEVRGAGSVWRVVGLDDESGVSVATMGA